MTANKKLQNGCEKIDINIVKEALTEGADINFVVAKWTIPTPRLINNERDNVTPLQMVFEITSRLDKDKEKTEFESGINLIQFLLEKGADPKGADSETTLLIEAISSSCFEIAKVLIKNKPELVKIPGELKCTPLHYACGAFGSGLNLPLELTQLILDAGADINAQDENGCTAACTLSQYGSIERFMEKIGLKLLTKLVENKADLSLANRNGISPLTVAAHRQDIRDAIIAGGYHIDFPLSTSKKKKIFFDSEAEDCAKGEDGELYIPFFSRYLSEEAKEYAHKAKKDDKYLISTTNARKFGVYDAQMNEDASNKRKLN